jgi:MYXO-CTERM domain-containing protein
MRTWISPALLLLALLAAAPASANMPAPDPCGRHREGEPCDNWPGVCRESPGTICSSGPCLICVNVDAGAPGAREEVVKPKSGCAVASGEEGAFSGLVLVALGAACLLRRRPRRAPRG